MLVAENEISRLKALMHSKGLPIDFIDGTCKEIEISIKTEVYTALESAMLRAYEAGEEYKADRFIEELTAVRIGDSFRVTTDSGITDFSTRQRQMLPNLLKNAKIAKDGSRYKVIPIGVKKNTTDGMAREMNAAKMKMKEIRDQFGAKDENVSGQLKDSREKISINPSVPSFRTATSKQDAGTRWVYPARNKDMTPILREINDTLFNEIQNIIENVIANYERNL